jgi:hypothetical protein
MKTIKNLLLILSAAAGLMVAAACDKNNADTPDEDEVFFEIDPEGMREYSIEQLADVAFGPEGSNADEEMAELREQFLKNARQREAELEAKYNTEGANGFSMGYVSYRYYYNSKDLDGNDVTLSAIVAWARYWIFSWYNLDPDHIYLFEHATFTSNAECPSQDGSIAMSNLNSDNLMIMPDYLGYGSSDVRTHPYMNREITALNSIDALVAGYEVWKKYGSGTLEDDWSLRVLGFGDGAANALAVHKYLDTHDDLASKWRFDYSFVCAGAYDPALTVKEWLKKEKVPFAVAIPMLIKSMLASYPDILKGFNENDFYSDKYMDVKSQIDRMLYGKETSTNDLNNKIGELLGANYTFKDILSEEALDPDSDLSKAFMTCLEKNNLTVGWTPKHQIKLFYTDEDEIVPPANSKEVVSAFGDKVQATQIKKRSLHDDIRSAWYAQHVLGGC